MSEETNVAPRRRSAAVPGFPAHQGFQAMRDEIDRMFQAMSWPEMNLRSGLFGDRPSIGLRVDVAETEGEIQVTTELPGVAEEDVEITLDDDILHIRAEKRSDKSSDDKTWHVVERSYGHFERAIRMPRGIDPSTVQASFSEGVLSVTLPKPPEEAMRSARKIRIGG
ncbi:MAG: Hsp20/alpha crystallin family protein [Pseudomonadota bacterium]